VGFEKEAVIKSSVIKEGKIIVRKKGENMRNMVDNYIPKC
jgi:hypothetical protein